MQMFPSQYSSSPLESAKGEVPRAALQPVLALSLILWKHCADLDITIDNTSATIQHQGLPLI
jgi:hypothetical protein